MANGNGDPGSYNQKEILTLFVLPALEEIKEKLDNKAESGDLTKLETRVDNLSKAAAELPGMFNKVRDLETKLTSPEKVANMIEEGLQASKNRGWTTRERVLGMVVACTSIVSLVVNLVLK